MSTTYDLYCPACEDHAYVFECTDAEQLLPALEHAQALAALPVVDEFKLRLEEGPELDLDFFKKHLGHEIVIQSDWGEITTLWGGQVDRARGIDLEIQSYEKRIERLRDERWKLFPKTPAMERYFEARERYLSLAPRPTTYAQDSGYTAAWNVLTAEEQDQVSRILKGNR